MSIIEMPLNVLGEIISYTGISALHQTCRALREKQLFVMAERGMELARFIPSDLWNANTYRQRGETFERVVHPLPLPSEPITEEQGLQFLKTAFDTARWARKQFSALDQKKFDGCTPQQCCVSLQRMTEILRIHDEILFTEILNSRGSPRVAREEQLKQLQDLMGISLQNKGIKSLPESIYLLTDLQTLYLEGNQLTSIPQTIDRLTTLEVLHLGSNRLTSIPQIGQLTNLEELYLNGNQLVSVPESLTRLSKLCHLDVRGNQDLVNEEAARILATLENRGCAVYCDPEMREAIIDLFRNL